MTIEFLSWIVVGRSYFDLCISFIMISESVQRSVFNKIKQPKWREEKRWSWKFVMKPLVEKKPTDPPAIISKLFFYFFRWSLYSWVVFRIRSASNYSRGPFRGTGGLLQTLNRECVFHVFEHAHKHSKAPTSWSTRSRVDAYAKASWPQFRLRWQQL